MKIIPVPFIPNKNLTIGPKIEYLSAQKHLESWYLPWPGLHPYVTLQEVMYGNTLKLTKFFT